MKNDPSPDVITTEMIIAAAEIGVHTVSLRFQLKREKNTLSQVSNLIPRILSNIIRGITLHDIAPE